ncbi:MAG: crossover junction endodeoxyribonuclease RuvC [Spirochaetaceae bacterium]|nr:crossover junction endodeoxyribonuclease RuvC [Spirochaetaceae bacterium]
MTSLKVLTPNKGFRRIIGVDPGLASSGWGIIEAEVQRIRYIAHGCIETKPDLPHSDRLLYIYEQFQAILEQYAPNESAMETLFFAKNVTSAIPVAEARGVLCVALAQRGLAVREYTPTVIKQSVVGRGGADKTQVQNMVRLILGLERIPKPDHAADALGAAVCSANTITPQSR